jgi:hypothetical protein
MRIIVFVLVVVTASITMLAPSVSEALARPHVALDMPASTEAGATPTFTWAVAGRPTGTRIVFQRAMGSGRIFRTVRVLHANTGSGALPHYALGLYTFRIAVTGSRRRLVARSTARTLRVYGNVPLSALCTSLTFADNFFFGCSTGASQASGHVFEYVAKMAMDNEGGKTTAITSPRTTCRSVALQFVGGVESESYVKSYTVALLQTSLDAVQVTGAPGQLEELKANLDGGAWQLTTQADRPYGAGALTLFVGGTASCYSSSGV